MRFCRPLITTAALLTCLFQLGCSVKIPPMPVPEAATSHNGSAAVNPSDIEWRRETAPPRWAQVEFEEMNAEFFPAVTPTFDSEEQAKANFDFALEQSVRGYYHKRIYNVHPRETFSLPASNIRTHYLKEKPTIIVTSAGDGTKPQYQAAAQIEIPRYLLNNWLQSLKNGRQFVAIQKTQFFAGGLIGVVAILALQAKLNQNSQGKRSGILRAAAAVAILCLLGGMTAAAIAGRIFTA